MSAPPLQRARIEGAIVAAVLLHVSTIDELGIAPQMFAVSLYRRAIQFARDNPGATMLTLCQWLRESGTATEMAELHMLHMGIGHGDEMLYADELKDIWVSDRLTDLFISLAGVKGTASHRLEKAITALRRIERWMSGKGRNGQSLVAGADTGKTPGESGKGKGEHVLPGGSGADRESGDRRDTGTASSQKPDKPRGGPAPGSQGRKT